MIKAFTGSMINLFPKLNDMFMQLMIILIQQ